MAKRDSDLNPIGRSRGIRRDNGAPADWAGANAELIRSAICAAAFVGGAIRFGYSRDGGAYAVGIYGDGEPYTEFVRPMEDLDDFLRVVISLYETIADEQAQSRIVARSKKKPSQGDLPV